MSEMRKVVLIGVDGATFDLIRPWMANRDLPNFSAVANDGVERVLESVFPTDFDSSVLTKLLNCEPAQRPVEQQSPIPYDGTQTAEVGDRDDVEDRLENLGYL